MTYPNFGNGEWRFRREDENMSGPIGGNLGANQATVLTQAALAGTGIALQPAYLAGPLIRSGQLVRLLPDRQPPELTIWGVHLARRHVPASLRTLLDFPAGRFEQNPEWNSD